MNASSSHVSDSELPSSTSSSDAEQSDEQKYPSTSSDSVLTSEDSSSFSRGITASEVLRSELHSNLKNKEICPSCIRKIKKTAKAEGMVAELLRSRLNSEPKSPSNSDDDEDMEDEKNGLSVAEVMGGQLNAEQKKEVTSGSTSRKSETPTESEPMVAEVQISQLNLEPTSPSSSKMDEDAEV